MARSPPAHAQHDFQMCVPPKHIPRSQPGVHPSPPHPPAGKQGVGVGGGSLAEQPPQLLGRGNGQGAGEVAAEVGGGFPVLPLQGRKERQLAVQEPGTVPVCQHQHLQEKERESWGGAQPAGTPCATQRQGGQEPAPGSSCPPAASQKLSQRPALGWGLSQLPQEQRRGCQDNWLLPSKKTFVKASGLVV